MFSLRNLIASTTRFFRSCNHLFGEVWRPVKRVLTYTFFACWGWGRSRNWFYFLQAIPAIAMLIAVLVVLGLRWTINADELEARYVESGKAGFKAKDYPLALVSYERLASMGSNRPEALYEMAVSLEAMGAPDRAERIMRQLAPDDQLGYGQAHLWRAAKLWKDLLDPQVRKHAEIHLKRSLEATVPEQEMVYQLLAEMYLMLGDYPEAERYYALAVDKRGDLRLKYAQVLAVQKKTDQATDQAKRAINYHKDRAERNLKDKRNRISWAMAENFLEKFPQALRVLQDGLDYDGDPEYRAVMASVFSSWQSFVAQKEPSDVTTQLSLLHKGLQLDPSNPAMLTRMIAFARSDDPKQSAKAKETLNEVVASGKATAAGHFLLGMNAWERKDEDAAMVHWEQALKLDPNLATVGNNVAWVLAHRKNPDYPRALKTIELVLSKDPNNATYHDTRGKILMVVAEQKKKKGEDDKGEWKEALTEFEFVKKVAPNFPEVHAALSIVYERLGISDLAATHRRLQADIDLAKKKAAKK